MFSDERLSERAQRSQRWIGGFQTFENSVDNSHVKLVLKVWFV